MKQGLLVLSAGLLGKAKKRAQKLLGQTRARRDLAAHWPRLGRDVATTSWRTLWKSEIEPRWWAKNLKTLSQMAGNSLALQSQALCWLLASLLVSLALLMLSPGLLGSPSGPC